MVDNPSFLNAVSQVRILLGATCDVSGHRNGLNLRVVGSTLLLVATGWSAGGVVVEGEVAEDLAGGGVLADGGYGPVVGQHDG